MKKENIEIENIFNSYCLAALQPLFRNHRITNPAHSHCTFSPHSVTCAPHNSMVVHNLNLCVIEAGIPEPLQKVNWFI